MKSMITEKCSLFRPYLKADQWCMGNKPETVNIIDVIRIPWQAQHDLIEDIRKVPTKDEKSVLKKQLWAFTPSSIMANGRGVNYITAHNGLMAFDIDGIKESLQEVFEIIKLIPYTLYCGKSASGNGLWGLFRITDKTKHSEHFDAMTASFKMLGIEIDPAPRSAASLRFACYDENAYYNVAAKPFDKLLEAIKIPSSVGKPKELTSISSTNNDADGKCLIENFNKKCTAEDMDEILINYGFNFHSQKGSRYRYTRPGKEAKAGLSVDYHEDIKTLFSFSSQVPCLSKWKQENSGWSCSPMTALLLYGCGGIDKTEWARAFNYIKSKYP